jgi:integrase/recombinase XerC
VSREHYDGFSVTIRSKWGRSVQVPVSNRLRAILDAAPLGAEPYVQLFHGPHTFKYSAVYGALRALARRHNLPPLHLHDLRRTMARKVYNATADLRVVQQLLGHDHLNSTLLYLQPEITAISRENLELAQRGDTIEQPVRYLPQPK